MAINYLEIKKQIRQKLSKPIDFEDTDNLLELGLSSLVIMKLVNQWRKQGIKISFGVLMEHPTLREWWELIQKTLEKADSKKRTAKKEKRIMADMYQEFPLTDVQYAYWVGRDERQALGGIGCHAYLEFDGKAVDQSRLRHAWAVVQQHHPMLRACFLNNGAQKILAKPYKGELKINDYSSMQEEEAQRAALSIRNRLSHRKLHIEKGEVAGLELTLLPHGKTRLHIDVDLLVADVQSLHILLRDIFTVYNGGELPQESKEWNFATYLKEQETEENEEKERAKEYWNGRLETLPKGPDLPLAKRPEEIQKPIFKRRVVRIQKREWENLQNRAKEYQTTQAMLLLTAYSAVLERWSRNKRFLVNIPYFNRKTEKTGLEDVIADFTTLLLLEVNCDGKPTFLELLHRIEKQLHEDMKNTSYSGVQVQRDMSKLHGEASVSAPIVFACNLGTPLVNSEFQECIGKFSYMISQTPQVWIDFQSYEDEEGIQLTWDSVDELFPEFMIQDMINSFEKLLHRLETENWEQKFDVLPENRKKFLEELCDVGTPEQTTCIHAAFLQRAREHPEKVALVDTGKEYSVTYGELKEYATEIAEELYRSGIRNEPVAITLPRGYEQIMAIMGVLLSGNMYVPVSGSQPKERRKLIHEKTGVRYVITNNERKKVIEWPNETKLFLVEEMKKSEKMELPVVSPSDSAYIIMTSGSTGVPKGVEIAHASAWNTIQDINKKYQVSEQDIGLAVSAIDFDLSLYDIFGILGVGGTLVLLPEKERRNAEYWLNQIKRYHVTIWNSVPVLLDMLCICAETQKEKLPLRVVMLSGDWIGMDLPERVATLTDSCKFVAMGGATEASIWSNYQNVTLPLPMEWKSIPYGRPLEHQSYRVVDEYGRDCPYWAEGELWIGGYGIAKGYRGDSALTNQKFFSDSFGRWYKTGDLGRFWQDGTIEFLGRKDHQVKIRGHRIELGEIEHTIQRCEGVEQVVVDTFQDGYGKKSLVAYIGAPLKSEVECVTQITCKDIFCERWKKVKKSMADWTVDKEKEKAYQKFMTYGNTYCIQLMLDTLDELEIFSKAQYSSDDGKIQLPIEIDKEQKETILRWVNDLLKEGIVREEQERIIKTGKKIELSECVYEVYDYFRQLKPCLQKILTGEENALDVFYEKNQELAPNRLISKIPGNDEIIMMLLRILEILTVSNKGNTVQILEIGTRDESITRKILENLKETNIVYTYTDTSQYFLQEIKTKLEGFKGIEYELLDLNRNLTQQQVQKHTYDIVISVNALHRNHDIAKSMRNISNLLKPNGIFLMTELTEGTYLQDITAALLEKGFSSISDERRNRNQILPDWKLWKEYLDKERLTDRLVEIQGFGRVLLCSRQKKSVLDYDYKKLQAYLEEKLPEYMIPKNYHFMEQLPMLSNGKLNRKELRENFKNEATISAFSKATTVTEDKLLEIWRKLFGYTTIGTEDNYFAIGGDSLVATKLISEVQKVFNCKLSIGIIFENPTIKALAKIIEQTEQEQRNILEIQPDVENRYEPFTLTDVQYAYWIGRSGLYSLGNVATHCYFELDAEHLDIQYAEKAWNMLIRRHGMMRVIIQPDGLQRILEHVPDYQIKIQDVRELDEVGKAKALSRKREDMSHQVIDTEKWPLFDVEITELTNEKQRIHISFDNIIFDGWSMFHILNEWAEIYKSHHTEEAIGLSFRDYVIGLEKIKKTSAYEEDKKYWEKRMKHLSPAPDFPLAKTEKQIMEQHFYRRSDKLSPKEWNVLKKTAREMGVTPSVFLISAYAETIRLWSNNKDFTLNLTQFDRKQLHPEVNMLVGDFTTLTLLETRDKEGKNFEERTKSIQCQLTADLEHSTYNAVEVERELKKNQENSQEAIMPVVFTSGLGVEQWNEGKWLGKLHYNISQTPQVWLDHQVVEMDGSLCLFWDSIDELFYPGMLDEMFRTYTGLLRGIAKKPMLVKERVNSLVSAEISETRHYANETMKTFDEKTLDEMFWEMAKKWPDREALVTENRRMTYREVREEALYISEQLRNEGVKKGEIVGVLMEKGWEQIVAVYGILFAGAAYLPLDIHNPQERLEKILNDSNTRVVLVKNRTINTRNGWLEKKKYISVSGEKCSYIVKKEKNKPENLAYVIYTSGSTGKPKGVMITHHSAANTIVDINSRNQVSEKDVALGISNLHFDLSVYDVFGILGAGGKIVLPSPDRAKDPAHWIELLNKEGVTIWNSVPAFVEMLVEYEEYRKLGINQKLRLILMSGDWIPVALPDRVRGILRTVKMEALGGATEASIWSNCYEIPDVIPENWKSIPYGKPLANQKYYILDQNMENCPNWVPGNLYIAGEGIALGYLNDEEKTKEKFIIWEKTGEKLYSTGDMGRYWSDGNIEFLGRVDNQIKINGYRVEIGEIENALYATSLVKKCMVSYEKDKLCAYIIKETESINVMDLQEQLSKILPEYMIPKLFYLVDEIPLTSNGKIDLGKMKNKVVLSEKDKINIAETVTEKELVSVWETVVGKKNMDIDESFFELGGDSIKIIRFINKINELYHKDISLHVIGENQTIRKLAKYIEGLNEENYLTITI